jgi:hypothetical protein
VGAGLNPVAFLGFLARRDPHDLDGIADHVSDELLASGAFIIGIGNDWIRATARETSLTQTAVE